MLVLTYYYYGEYFNFLNDNYSNNCYSISTSTPKNFKGKHLDILKPGWDLVNMAKKGDINNYTEIYNGKLNDIGINNIIKEVENKDVVILFCHDNPNKFCHRFLVSNWFLKNNIQSMEINSTIIKILKGELNNREII